MTSFKPPAFTLPSLILVTMLLLPGCTTDPADNAPSTDAPQPTPNPPSPNAVRLTDFTDPADNARWFPVLDNVMGGRSDGGIAFAPDADPAHLLFTGDINTNGGGFASVRYPLEAGALTDTQNIQLRVRVPNAPGLRDRGPFRLLVIDDLHTLPAGHPDRRPRRILHRHDLPLDPQRAGQWQTVAVDLDALTPTFHGDPVPNAAPLYRARAVEFGFILNDTPDGPFRLDVAQIDVVR